MNVSFRILISTCIASAALSLTAFSANAQSLRVTLNSDSANLKSSDDVSVSVTITNISSRPILVPKWYVPSRATTSGVFTVLRDGQPVPYLGALVKRRAFGAKDFVRLAAGASLDSKVELSSLYDLGTSGVYTIHYDVKSVPAVFERASNASGVERQAAAADADSQSLDLASNAIALTITADQSVGVRRLNDQASAAAPVAEFAASVSFVGCSNTRTTQIQTALTSAESYAANSRNYLNAGNRGPRYTTWFGSYTSSRYSTVRSHFTNISDAASTKPLVFDCSTCPTTDYADAYAYVYSNQPYRVYLCNAFWAAPNTGTDSRAGTIIHELSHFSVVAGTNDYVYGQTGARRLASTNPNRAVRNADNHEYFAENTPAQN